MTKLSKSKADELTMDTDFLSAELTLPKLTVAERGALAAPTTGQLIYNSDSNKLNFYTGSVWEEVTST